MPSLSLLAAGAAPPFFAEVAALLVASAVMAYFCHRLGVTPIVSFLVTGALIGPGVLGLVQDRALIEAAAEVGVVLLLFTIGIEFSLEKLARIQRLIFVGGGLQVGLVVAVVTGLLYAYGIGWRTGVFTGCLFSATFFVSVGLLLDLGFLAANLPLVLAVVGAVLVLKMLATAASVKLLGYDLGTAMFSSLMIAQVGEFSFVLERTGREVGLFPAGFENGGPQAFIAATVLSMMITPLLAKAGAGLEGWRRRRVEGRHAEDMAMSQAQHHEARAAGTHAHFEDHVVQVPRGGGGLGLVLRRRAHAMSRHPADGRRCEDGRGIFTPREPFALT